MLAIIAVISPPAAKALSTLSAEAAEAAAKLSAKPAILVLAANRSASPDSVTLSFIMLSSRALSLKLTMPSLSEVMALTSDDSKASPAAAASSLSVPPAAPCKVLPAAIKKLAILAASPCN